MIAAAFIEYDAEPVMINPAIPFRSKRTAQRICRDLLSDFDEDELLYLEVEINAYLENGTTTRRLERLLGAIEHSA